MAVMDGMRRQTVLETTVPPGAAGKRDGTKEKGGGEAL